MKPSLVLLPLALAGLLASAFAETVKDREAAVRQDKAAMENDARWIYNDFQSGSAEAKKSGRPLLVVLRCVPCLACAGIDASVLTEPQLTPLLDQFVCVRVINANALDVSLFQFDDELSFSTVFFNGDGTVYGRYGSWTHQKNAQDKTSAGYEDAMEAVSSGSIAAKTGLEAGDDLIALAGQPPVSSADVTWVLHRAPEAGLLPIRVRRGDAEKSLQLELPDGWRSKTSISGRVGTWAMRAMSSGGLLLEDLPDGERARRNFGTNGMALLVKHAGEHGKHAAAKKASFKKGDVVVTLDGRSARISESELIGQLLREHRPGESVKAVVLRDEERLDLSLPMQ